LQKQAFLNQINEIIPDIERKSTSESVKLLMNSNDYHANKLAMKFISLCMKIRDTLLSSSESNVTYYNVHSSKQTRVNQQTALISVNPNTRITHTVRSEGLPTIQMPG